MYAQGCETHTCSVSTGSVATLLRVQLMLMIGWQDLLMRTVIIHLSSHWRKSILSSFIICLLLPCMAVPAAFPRLWVPIWELVVHFKEALHNWAAFEMWISKLCPILWCVWRSSKVYVKRI